MRARRDNEYVICADCQQWIAVPRVWDSQLPDKSKVTYATIPHHVMPGTNTMICEGVGAVTTVTIREEKP